MKQVYAVLAATVILCSSCQRSQFATTTRVCKNGRTSYTKSYIHERKKVPKAIPRKERRMAGLPSKGCPDSQGPLQPETVIIKSIPGIQPASLIASTTMEPAYVSGRIINDPSHARPQLVSAGQMHPDTTVKEKQRPDGQKEAAPADTRKVEKLGLAGFILSIPGLVPIVCLPLAILGVIFGALSLRKIKRNPTLYKGKGFAIASIVMGVLGILGILLFIG